MKTAPSRLTWFFLLCLLAPVLRATSVVAPSFPELVAEARVIARVKVAVIRAVWVETPDGRTIKTLVTFNVEKILKGAPAPELTLSFLGGELEGQSLRVQGVPSFVLGQTDIVFISDLSGAEFCPLVGVMHGRYRVRTDPATARRYVARNDGTPLESEADVQLPQAVNSPANRLKSVGRAFSPEVFEQKITAEAHGTAVQP